MAESKAEMEVPTELIPSRMSRGTRIASSLEHVDDELTERAGHPVDDQKRADELFDLVDENGDGVVTRPEFGKLYGQMKKAIHAEHEIEKKLVTPPLKMDSATE